MAPQYGTRDSGDPRLKPHRRPLIGHPAPQMAYLSPEDVEGIHRQLVRDFATSEDPINPPGVRDQNLLASAVHRVHTSLGGERKYPTVPMAGAAYLHAIIGNHPFHNGNKRTALVSTLVFFDLNGFVLDVDEGELFDHLLRIADHKIVEGAACEGLADAEMREIAMWLHRNSRPVAQRRTVWEERISDFILKYRNTLDRLAKV